MKKLFIIIAVITVVIIGGGIFIFSRGQKGSQASLPLPTKPEYYWGEGCVHCANVDAFINSWDKKAKIDWIKYEVRNDQANAQRMLARATYCKLPLNQVGTPMLFTPDGKCIDGDTPIIDYLKSTIQ